MATTGMPTLLDIAKGNGLGQEGYVEEAIVAVPELERMPVDTIPGQQYKTLVRTALPTVDSVRQRGKHPSKGVYEPRLVETFILNPTWQVDKAAADIWHRGPRTPSRWKGLA